MDLDGANERADRFSSYMDALASVIGHDSRVGPLRDYCTGLLLPAPRKSVEPIAAKTAPKRTAAQHQCLLHFVGNGGWSDEDILGKVRDLVLPKIEAHGAITSWIIDDTGFPKKGKESVGVGRQYCGQRGKTDNCQVAVSLSVANAQASLPVAYRLYLPETWSEDLERRAKVNIPKDIPFQTKPQIALDQLRAACRSGLSRGTVLADSAYGVDSEFRRGISDLHLLYAVGIGPLTGLWAPGRAPLPPKPYAGRGRRALRPMRDETHRPQSAKDVARSLPETAWEKIEWREGTNTPLVSRFARLRVRSAHDEKTPHEAIPEEWLVAEWPVDEAEPMKYWLSTLPADISFIDLIGAIKMRWRIERDYLDLKQEVGLGHYEGRGWRGFHHHATLCIASYGFLVLEKAAFSPCAITRGGHRDIFGAKFAIPENYRPRGAAAAH